MKKIIALVAAVILVLSLVGCGNRQLIDTTHTFDRAIINLPNGDVVEGEVKSWKDYDGDQIQVKIDDTTYLTHVSNVVLISE